MEVLRTQCLHVLSHLVIGLQVASSAMKPFCIALVSLGSALAAPRTFQPDVMVIVRHSIATTEVNWSEASSYAFLSRDVKTKHDSEQTNQTFDVLMIEGSPYRRLVAQNDHALTEPLRSAEDRKMQAETKKRERESDRERRKRMAIYLDERNRDRAMLCEIADAFDYSLAGEENLENHATWVLEGVPKPDYQPKNRDARVMSHMRVKLWIDQESYQWVKVEAEVLKAVSLYGSLAKVGPGTKFKLEQAPVAPNIWLPKHFSVEINASALGFLDESSTQDHTYYSYRRRTVLSVDSRMP
jgi:hypothetical protein